MTSKPEFQLEQIRLGQGEIVDSVTARCHAGTYGAVCDVLAGEVMPCQQSGAHFYLTLTRRQAMRLLGHVAAWPEDHPLAPHKTAITASLSRLSDWDNWGSESKDD